MGDEGDGTVSGFVLRPLGGPGLPYFQSSYPCVIAEFTCLLGRVFDAFCCWTGNVSGWGIIIWMHCAGEIQNYGNS